MGLESVVLMENRPSWSVEVITGVPLIRTVTPANGPPVSSSTWPEMVACVLTSVILSAIGVGGFF